MAPDVCPKCGTHREPAHDACARCGLLVTRWETYRASAPQHPALDEAFSSLDARWGEPEAHEAFLALARSLGALDVAAAKYRAVLRERGDPVAERALQRLLTLAAHQQANAPRDEMSAVRVLSWATAALAAILIAVVAVVVWKIFTVPRP